MLDEKVGFDIGWDYFSFGMKLPSWLEQNEFVLAFCGFNAAKSRGVTRSDCDRYVKKHMQLRVNAWRRGRLFDPAVTPAFIERIDLLVCPVTKIKLTHGTGGDGDWSVDRINNDAAYSPGNLVIVSVLANAAKGNYSYNEIRRFALDPSATLPAGVDGMRPLTRVEWMRWTSICSHILVSLDSSSHFEFDAVPCVAAVPKNIPMNPSSSLQIAIGLFVSGIDVRPLKEMLAAIPKPKRRVLHQVVARAKKASKGGLSALGIWFNERLFCEFFSFFTSLSCGEKQTISQVSRRTMGSKGSFEICPENWGIEDAGYAPKTLAPCVSASAVIGAA